MNERDQKRIYAELNDAQQPSEEAMQQVEAMLKMSIAGAGSIALTSVSAQNSLATAAKVPSLAPKAAGLLSLTGAKAVLLSTLLGVSSVFVWQATGTKKQAERPKTASQHHHQQKHTMHVYHVNHPIAYAESVELAERGVSQAKISMVDSLELARRKKARKPSSGSSAAPATEVSEKSPVLPDQASDRKVDQLTAELDLLRGMNEKEALSQRGYDLLLRHKALFPQGQLALERDLFLALRACSKGQFDQGKALLQRHEAKKNYPLALRVAASCEK